MVGIKVNHLRFGYGFFWIIVHFKTLFYVCLFANKFVQIVNLPTFDAIFLKDMNGRIELLRNLQMCDLEILDLLRRTYAEYRHLIATTLACFLKPSFSPINVLYVDV